MSSVRGVRTQPGPEDLPGIWPEATQTEADQVVDTPEWRLRPDVVATRFAEGVLGWSAPIVGNEQPARFAPWLSSFTVRPEPAGPSVTATVGQLVGDQAWVVTHVSAPSPT